MNRRRRRAGRAQIRKASGTKGSQGLALEVNPEAFSRILFRRMGRPMRQHPFVLHVFATGVPAPATSTARPSRTPPAAAFALAIEKAPKVHRLRLFDAALIGRKGNLTPTDVRDHPRFAPGLTGARLRGSGPAAPNCALCGPSRQAASVCKHQRPVCQRCLFPRWPRGFFRWTMAAPSVGPAGCPPMRTPFSRPGTHQTSPRCMWTAPGRRITSTTCGHVHRSQSRPRTRGPWRGVCVHRTRPIALRWERWPGAALPRNFGPVAWPLFPAPESGGTDAASPDRLCLAEALARQAHALPRAHSIPSIARWITLLIQKDRVTA